MATITLKGTPIHTVGSLPTVGSKAPPFSLVTSELGTMTSKELLGKRIVLNIFPSVDTPTCAASVRKFNAEASNLPNTVVLCISKDLPFAHKRFCAAEGLKNVHGLSDFRSPSFGADYGVTISDGPLQGLLSRAVVIVDQTGTVIATEQVGEIANEPNYTQALAKLR